MSPPAAFVNTSVSSARHWLLLEKNMPGISDGFLQSYMEKRQTAWRLRMRSAHGNHASHFHTHLLLLGRGMGRKGQKQEGQRNEFCYRHRLHQKLWESHIREHKCDPLATGKASGKLVMILRYFNKTAISISMCNYHSTVMSEFKYYKYLASTMGC